MPPAAPVHFGLNLTIIQSRDNHETSFLGAGGATVNGVAASGKALAGVNVTITDSSGQNVHRKAGEAPALDEEEIGDLIAFLKTLNDGYSAKSGAARTE